MGDAGDFLGAAAGGIGGFLLGGPVGGAIGALGGGLLGGAFGGSDVDISVPGPSPEERQLASEQVALLRQQRDILSRQLREQALLQPFLLGRAGFRAIRDEAGRIIGFEEIPFEELPEDIQARREIEELFLERTGAALRGELPVNPGLLSELEEEEQTLREALRQQLGPGFETSTPGMEALGRFAKRRSELLEAARRGDLTLAEQLGIARAGAEDVRLGNLFNRMSFAAGFPFRNAPQFSQIAQGFQMPLSQLFGQRQLQTGANIAAAQARAQVLGQLFGGLGQGVGTLGGLFAGRALFPPKG